MTEIPLQVLKTFTWPQNDEQFLRDSNNNVGRSFSRISLSPFRPGTCWAPDASGFEKKDSFDY